MVDGLRNTRNPPVTEPRPTEKQYGVLLMLGSGSALLTGTKRTVEPLVRRGWVTAGHGYSWVRITPDGLRALAAGAEKYGLPEFTKATIHPKVCSECGQDWRPKCRCGSRMYRFEAREVEAAA